MLKSTVFDQNKNYIHTYKNPQTNLKYKKKLS